MAIITGRRSPSVVSCSYCSITHPWANNNSSCAASASCAVNRSTESRAEGYCININRCSTTMLDWHEQSSATQLDRWGGGASRSSVYTLSRRVMMLMQMRYSSQSEYINNINNNQRSSTPHWEWRHCKLYNDAEEVHTVTYEQQHAARLLVR